MVMSVVKVGIKVQRLIRPWATNDVMSVVHIYYQEHMSRQGASNYALQRSFYHKDLRDKLSVASSWLCALGIAITTTLPQRVFPIVQDCPFTESAKCA